MASFGQGIRLCVVARVFALRELEQRGLTGIKRLLGLA